MNRIFLAIVFFALSINIFAQPSKTNRPDSPNSKKNQRPIAETKPTPTKTENSEPNTPTETTQDQTTTNLEPQNVDNSEVISIDTNLVNIPFKVYDRDGRFAINLKKEDFEVYEDGVKQEIVYFSNEEQPFTVILLLDVSLSTRFKIAEIQNAAIAFTTQLREKDKVMVIAFDSEVQELCQPTNDREILKTAIKQTKFGGGTSLYEAVGVALKNKISRISGRKAIVLFTDGVDTTSRKTNYEETLREAEESEALVYAIQYDTFQDVQNASNNGTLGSPIPIPTSTPTLPKGSGRLPTINIPIITQRRNDPNRYPNPNDPRNPNPNDPNNRYPNPNDPNSRYPNPNDPNSRYPNPNDPIGLPGSGNSRREYEIAAKYLQQLTYNSGGRLFNADSYYYLGGAFTQIAEELRQQYSLAYYPTDEGKIGQKKKVKVKTFVPKLSVKARDSYVVGKEKTEATKKKKK